MNYLTPEIAKLSRRKSNKSLAKPGVSCGIFQDCLDTNVTYTKKMLDFNRRKNG